MRLARLIHEGKRLPPEFREWVKQYAEPGIKKKTQITVTFGSSGQELAIRHKLGTVPTGFTVIDQDGAGSVYRDSTTSKPTPFFLFLKSSGSGITVTLEIF